MCVLCVCAMCCVCACVCVATGEKTCQQWLVESGNTLLSHPCYQIKVDHPISCIKRGHTGEVNVEMHQYPVRAKVQGEGTN